MLIMVLERKGTDPTVGEFAVETDTGEILAVYLYGCGSVTRTTANKNAKDFAKQYAAQVYGC